MTSPVSQPDAAHDLLSLLDWKRQIFDLYRSIRADDNPARAWQAWRDVRDDLFVRHPQSPLDSSRRDGFAGLDYFDYDPAARVLAAVRPVDPAVLDIPVSRGDPYRFTRFGEAGFELYGRRMSLGLCWLEGYGGGVFLSFTDATSGETTYGAGRYLLDTVKGADLGMGAEKLVLDFNFAYNPSCAYDPHWACPLAPTGNRLPVAVRAGERIA